jgi:hypothetical protein
MWITRWPLPALWSWLAAWFFYAAALFANLPPGPALALGAAIAAGLGWLNGERWRRLIVALGFPASVLALGWQGGASGLLWLAPLALLWWLYPRRTWSEAPLFPTPRGALAQLSALAPLPPGARALDAGCGVGDGLRELVHMIVIIGRECRAVSMGCIFGAYIFLHGGNIGVILHALPTCSS